MSWKAFQPFNLASVAVGSIAPRRWPASVSTSASPRVPSPVLQGRRRLTIIAASSAEADTSPCLVELNQAFED